MDSHTWLCLSYTADTGVEIYMGPDVLLLRIGLSYLTIPACRTMNFAAPSPPNSL